MPINRNPAELYFGAAASHIYSGLAKLGVPVMPVLTHAHPMLAERLHQDSLRIWLPGGRHLRPVGRAAVFSVPDDGR